MVPSYLSHVIHIKSKSRYLRSNTTFLLDVPNVFIKSVGNRAFSYRGPDFFNALPDDIQMVDNQLVFKG